MYDVVTNAAGNSWMFENRIVMWWMAITPRIQPSIFLLRTWSGCRYSQSPALPAAIGLNALNMFTSASNAGYGKEDDSALSRFSLASLYRERNHDQDWLIADDFTGATDIASFLVENGYQRYKLTVFQQVKCRKQSTHGDQPENAFLSGG